jgi:hypothetical protein
LFIIGNLQKTPVENLLSNHADVTKKQVDHAHSSVVYSEQASRSRDLQINHQNGLPPPRGPVLFVVDFREPPSYDARRKPRRSEMAIISPLSPKNPPFRSITLAIPASAHEALLMVAEELEKHPAVVAVTLLLDGLQRLCEIAGDAKPLKATQDGTEDGPAESTQEIQ